MLERMQWFTQAIAQQPSTQIELFPEFVEVADELALGWEEAHRELQSIQAQLTPAQFKAIEDLDDYLAYISGKANLSQWTVEALTTSSEWQLLRNLAGKILEQMNWPKTPPPHSNELYVRLPR